MNRRALMLSLADPWRVRDGGTLRNRAMEQHLRNAEFEVELAYPSSPAGELLAAGGWVARRLRAMKRNLLPMPTAFGARDDGLRTRVGSSEAGVIHISALSQASYRRHTSAVLWLDFMDLWSSFALREAASRGLIAATTARGQAAWLTKQEVRACRDAWLVTAAGWSDTLELQSRGIPAIWLPTTLPDHEFIPVERGKGPSKTAGFLGNFNYWPNREAYASLVEHWVPTMVDSGWSVLVAGLGSDTLSPLPDGVEILGPVRDVNDFYAQVDATLAPIALGGGIKVKVIESLAKAVPVIGTEFAFDGFPEEFHDLFVKVDLCRPDFAGLPVIERLDLPDDRLSAFRETDASAYVRTLLAQVPQASRQGER